MYDNDVTKIMIIWVYYPKNVTPNEIEINNVCLYIFVFHHAYLMWMTNQFIMWMYNYTISLVLYLNTKQNANIFLAKLKCDIAI